MFLSFTALAVLVAWPCLLVAGRNPSDVKRNAIELCGQNDRDIYKISDDQWCCLCPPGYYKVDDCSFGVPKGTTCKRCIFDPEDSNNQTYMTSENNETQCFKSPNDSYCQSSMNTEYKPGNRTHPSRCKCKEGFYSLTDPYEHGCNEHSPCNPGFQPARIGTSSSDTKCEICPEGTFSNVSSSSSLCMSFSLCGPDRDIEKPGTTKTDFVCSAAVVTQDNFTDTPTTTTTEAGREDNIDIGKGSSEASLTPIIVGVVISAVAIAIIFIVIFCIRKSKLRKIKKRANKDQTGNDGSSRDEGDVETGSLDENSQDFNCNGTRLSALDENGKRAETMINSEISESQVDDPLLGANKTRVSESDENGERTKTMIITSEISESTVDQPLRGANKSSNCKFENVETETAKIQNTSVGTENKDSPHSECSTESLETKIIKRLKEKGGVCYENDEVLEENVSIRLRDDVLGREMLLHLNKHKKSDLRPFVRKFLDEGEIDDVEESNHRDVRELKYQWLLACTKKLSRNLTPAHLLRIGIFQDDMLDIFIDNFTPINVS